MKRRLLLPALAVLVACGDTPTETVTPPTALAPPVKEVDCSLQNNNTIKKLTVCVTLEGVQGHQQALQDIADANGGNRLSGSAGGTATEQYVRGMLEDAGYAVSLHPVTFYDFDEVGPSVLTQIVPASFEYARGADFVAFTETEPGDVTAPVTAVDLDLGLGNGSTSGCEAADFAGFPAGHIALLQRGTCDFFVKAENAEAAGAVGAIIFNQGDTPARLGLIGGTLTQAYSGSIPVVNARYALGVEWAGTPGLQMGLFANVRRGDFTGNSVVAESVRGAPENVVMAGAHLDAVGPGINDNGSGVAALLEVARQMKLVRPENKVRFAFWTGLVQGQLGSTDYVSNLSQAELEAVALYLNFDVIGSPNPGFFVFDGDGSEVGFTSPDGSAAIESFFQAFYAERDIPTESHAVSTDYNAFFFAGVPIGGLYTGTSELKTPQQVADWGGVPGEQFDPCWLQACDTEDNVNFLALDVNSDAVAASVLQYAMSTEAVNGRQGRGNFGTPNGPPDHAGGPGGPAPAEAETVVR